MKRAKANRAIAEFMQAHEEYIHRGSANSSDVEYTELQFKAAKSKLQRILIMSSEIQLYDMIADEDIQVEIQYEAAFAGKFKLYVHQAGRSIVRICKLQRHQITIPERFHVIDTHREGLSANAPRRDKDDISGSRNENPAEL